MNQYEIRGGVNGGGTCSDVALYGRERPRYQTLHQDCIRWQCASAHEGVEGAETKARLVGLMPVTRSNAPSQGMLRTTPGHLNHSGSPRLRAAFWPQDGQRPSGSDMSWGTWCPTSCLAPCKRHCRTQYQRSGRVRFGTVKSRRAPQTRN